MARKVADCRKFPSETNCTLTITGEEDEVVRAATEHAVSVHGHTMSDELTQQIRALLENEPGPVVPTAPSRAAPQARRSS